MAFEVCLVCDRCSTIIAAAKSRRAVEKEAQMLYTVIKGKDVCTNCEPLPHNKRALTS